MYPSPHFGTRQLLGPPSIVPSLLLSLPLHVSALAPFVPLSHSSDSVELWGLNIGLIYPSPHLGTRQLPGPSSITPSLLLSPPLQDSVFIPSNPLSHSSG